MIIILSVLGLITTWLVPWTFESIRTTRKPAKSNTKAVSFLLGHHEIESN